MASDSEAIPLSPTVMASISEAISLSHAGDCFAPDGARNDNAVSWRAQRHIERNANAKICNLC